jgi:hypothetical protein
MRIAGRWSPVLALAVVGALYFPGIVAPGAGTFHDDGIYLVTAQGLAEGDGYRIVSLPDAELQTKYPPLFPISLAAVWRLAPEFPANLPVLRLLTVFWILLWCRFAYLVLRRERDRPTALVIALLTLCSPWVYFLATSMMSEGLFAVLTWAALWEYLGYEDRPDEPAGRRRLLLAAVLGGAATLTRLLGVSLIGACFVALLVRRRVRDALVFAAVSAAVVTPWIAWTTLAGSSGPDGYYTAANYWSWNLVTGFSLAEAAIVAGRNLFFFFFLTPGYLFGFFGWQSTLLLLALGLLTLTGLAARLRRGPNVLDLFLLVYAVMVLLWPWPPTRFFAPLYPLILLYAWSGVETVWRILQGGAPPGALLRRLIAGTALILAVAMLGASSLAVTRTGMIAPTPVCHDDWREFERLFAWVEARTSKDAVLAANLDPALFLYTGRKALRPFEADPAELYYSRKADREPLGPPAELARRLRAAGADYLVTTPGTCFGETAFLNRQVDALLDHGGGTLREVARLSAATRVYAGRPE